MKSSLEIFAALLLLFGASIRCVAQNDVTGVVVDKNGRPISGVVCILAGTAAPTNGTRVIDTGIARPVITDNEGRFAIPQSEPLVDLQFDGTSNAPVFLYRINPKDGPLRVVMTGGKVLRGRVVDDKQIPIANAEIELQMPQEDRWYQRKQITNTNGEFQFRILEPPQNSPWVLCYGGKRFKINYYGGKRSKIDYAQVTPETSITLTAGQRMTVTLSDFPK
jgi:hypothetical protein